MAWSVEVVNADEIQAKLAGVDKPIQTGLRQVADQALEDARQAFQGGTGKAAQSLFSQVTSSMVEIQSSMPPEVVSSIDQGRPAGQSIRALLPGLITWREAVGAGPLGIELALQIKASGTRGKRVLETTERNAATGLEQTVRDLDGEIERWWNE